eukprot:m.489174 g.489174  ORF g.489174 m.489174 type:complete len:563 (+) comp26461_c0_seq1:107-1795(+)
MDFTSMVTSILDGARTGDGVAQAASSAQRLAYALPIENPDSSALRAINERQSELTDALLLMIKDPSTPLRHCDNFVYLLTGARTLVADKAELEDKVYEALPECLPVFVTAFEKDPNGYTAPELLSCWSSMLNERGHDFALKYITPNQIVDVVMPVVKSKTVGSIVACMFLANLIGHEEDKADIFKDCIPMIAEGLRAAFSGAEVYEREWGPGTTTKALASISVSDANKDIIKSLELLPLLDKVLSFGDDDYPVKGFKHDYYEIARGSAAKAMWNMAFKHDVRKDCPDVVAHLKAHVENPQSSKRLKENCQGALFQIAKRDAELAPPSAPAGPATPSKKVKGHVMLSYQWDHQPLMVYIKDNLQSRGYKVWMDIEQMKASTLEAMAKAIEDAAVVIVCMTPRYKQSESCRTEGEYAFAMRKKVIPLMAEQGYRPDGWLGALLGTKLWYDMSDPEKRETKLQEMLGELEEFLTPSDDASSTTADPQVEALQKQLDASKREIENLKTQLAQASSASSAASPVQVTPRGGGGEGNAALERKMDTLLDEVRQLQQQVTASSGCCTVS